MPPYNVGNSGCSQRPINAKIPDKSCQGVTSIGDPKGMGSEKTADQLPDRVSLLHKGGFPLCNSGCGDPIVEHVPSSIGQLPVPTALNAGSPTLFRNYYTVKHWKSKYLLSKGWRNCSLAGKARSGYARSQSDIVTRFLLPGNAFAQINWRWRGSAQRLPLSGELSKIFDF